MVWEQMEWEELASSYCNICHIYERERVDTNCVVGCHTKQADRLLHTDTKVAE
jgi:hypothetical protein